MLIRGDLIDACLPDIHLIGDMIKRLPIVVSEDHSLREAADHMVNENVGRVIVIDAKAPHRMVGILTRGDLLAAHAQRLREANDSGRHIRVRQAIRNSLSRRG